MSKRGDAFLAQISPRHRRAVTAWVDALVGLHISDLPLLVDLAIRIARGLADTDPFCEDYRALALALEDNSYTAEWFAADRLDLGESPDPLTWFKS